MRRGSNTLLIILAIFLLLGAGAVAYFMFLGSTANASPFSTAKAPPTVSPPQQIVEAVVDIKTGTVISTTNDLIKMTEISGEEYAKSPKTYFTTLEAVKGQKALQDLVGGKPVLQSEVGLAGLADRIPPPLPGREALHAFPVQLNTLSGVADLIQPGDYVDIMASFNQNVMTLRPGLPFTMTKELGNAGASGSGAQYTGESTVEGSTKVLVQDVQVLDVLHPAPPPAAGTPTAAPAAPATPPLQAPQAGQKPDNGAGTDLVNGNWVVVVAVTNQEAEVLRFTLDRDIGISMLLRRSGDHATQHTVGATLRILIDNFGMPIGSTLPSSQHPGLNVPEVPVLPKEGTEKFAPIVAATQQAAK
ncbi:MAG: hypothetical protein H0X37_08935 [Herpetosiphonaceae bacterium]|nr:hypothetical protein [Herpetosiphonaceae bacterium]